MDFDFIRYANSIFQKKQIKLYLIDDCEDIWEQTFSNIHFQSTQYIKEMVNYQGHYFNEKFHDIIEQSVVIFSNNAPIAIWPLTISKTDTNSAYQFNSHGGAILPPLFVKTYPLRASNRLMHSLYKLLLEFGAKNFFGTPLFSDIFTGTIGVNEWYAQVIAESKECITNYVQYIHIEKGMEFINLNIRKAYKPLISDAQKRFETTFVTADNSEDFFIYKNLHAEVSGRKTRGENTWKTQQNMIKNNRGFCVLISYKSEFSGAAFFLESADEASYFSGAYRKNKVSESLGHLALYSAINYALKKNIKWFRLGKLRINQEKKISDIDFFKNGFASHVITENQIGIIQE